MMERQRYIVIQEWMLELGLVGSELVAYALIYGFCQDGESDFHGSASYVAQWCNVRREQAVRILRKLVDMGLLLKVGGEAGYPVHYALPKEGCAISAHPTKPHTPCAISAPLSPHTPHTQNNIDTSIDREHTLRAREDADLIAFGDHVRMTAAEHEKLVARFGAQDTDRLCEILDGYLDNPKRTNRYRSHYRAILGWVVTRLQEEKLTAQRMENAKQQAQRAQGIQQAPSGFGRAAADAKRRLEAIQAKYDTPAK